MNIIPAAFDPTFRAQVAQQIRYYGIERVEKMLLASEFHPSFAKAIIRSIIRKEGW